MRKKNSKNLSLLLCLFFIYYIVLASFPFVHNLKADLNVWNVKLVVILEGKHNREDNPQSACFDFYQIRLVEVGDCPVCQLGSNNKLLSFSFVNNFFYDTFIKKSSFSDLYHFSTYEYDIPHLRAPPVS